MDTIDIREIQPGDNAALARVIRDTLVEFNANHPGTVYFDATTDHLYDLFQAPGSVYYTAVVSGKIAGGVGIFPSEGIDEDTCELVKMYLIPPVRGKGLGKLLIEKAIAFAASAGYKKIYIETMPELRRAMNVYEKFGFEYLDKPYGNTGHFGCDVWMLKRLEAQPS